jgi:hypothetical protein
MPHFLALKTCVLASILLAFPYSACFAEVLELVGGARIEGTWKNPSDTTSQEYLFETTDGVTLRLAANQVRRVIPLIDEEQTYVQGLARIEETAEAHARVVDWCEGVGLRSLGNAHRERLLDLDPEHRPTRATLGYVKTESDGWVHESVHWGRLGLQRKGNKWRFPEEIAIEDAQTQQREAEAAAGKRIELALREILQESKRSADALATLRHLNDPLAVPRIAKLISENRQENGNPAIRRELVDLLGRIGNAPAIRVLCETALRDEQRPIRDRAVEIIRNSGQTWAPEFFIEYLANRNPKTDNPLEIDRAAEALGSLPDPRAIRPLIDSLVTVHKQVSTVGAGSGAGFNNDGGIGFGQGSKEVEMTFQKEHPQVLSTLLMYAEGANYQYDEDAWRQWYADTHARTNLTLRRDP